jgi:hypothetical protein
MSAVRMRVVMVLLAMVGSWMTMAPSASAVMEYTVSGHVTAPLADLTNHSVGVSTGIEGHVETVTGAVIQPDGSYSVQVPAGTYEFSFVGQGARTAWNTRPTYSTQKDVVVTGNMVVDATLTGIVLTVDLVGPDGTPRAGQIDLTCNDRVQVEEDFHFREVRKAYLQTSAKGAGAVQLTGLAVAEEDGHGPGCDLVVYPDDGSWENRHVLLTAGGENRITVVIPDPVTLSGKILTPQGPVTTGDLDIFEGDTARRAAIYRFDNSSDGSYRVRLAPGRYSVRVSGWNEHEELGMNVFDVDVTHDRTLDFSWPSVPVKVRLVDEEGQPVPGYVRLGCTNYGDGNGGPHGTLRSETPGVGEVEVSAMVTEPGEVSCSLKNEDESVSQSVRIKASGNEFTYVVPTGEVRESGPEASVDQDGVSDAVESQAPHNGDGNNDGVPDAQQANVSSLPAEGAAPGTGVPFVTVAGPEGSTVYDVSTMKTSDAASPPPAGVTLPAGLTSFVLNDVEYGADQTVSIYPGSMTGVTSYAKYQAGAWTLLPADRVTLFSDHLDIKLTDGGVGDDDGAQNGRISDPGGPAIIRTGDTTPPIVTGKATTKANGNGWYAGNVRIHWTATDPGSGVATPPADTTVSEQGANVTAQSPTVCDKAPTPNCGTGTVTGLKIDKTAPSLSVTGVSNGATYVLGSALPGCAASDALSGLNGSCKGLLAGGNASKVGQFAYAAAVTDKAGNPRAAAVAFKVVYSFDGFATPVNDPTLSPGSPVSVFRAGSIVPLVFSLKNSSGQPVTPTNKPSLVAPVKGAKATGAVNETVVNGAGTSGSSFVLKNGRWQFDWSTKGLVAGYLYKVGVKLDDGTTHYVTVGVR